MLIVALSHSSNAEIFEGGEIERSYNGIDEER
jgi:hypothetical protein